MIDIGLHVCIADVIDGPRMVQGEHGPFAHVSIQNLTIYVRPGSVSMARGLAAAIEAACDLVEDKDDG